MKIPVQFRCSVSVDPDDPTAYVDQVNIDDVIKCGVSGLRQQLLRQLAKRDNAERLVMITIKRGLGGRWTSDRYGCHTAPLVSVSSRLLTSPNTGQLRKLTGRLSVVTVALETTGVIDVNVSCGMMLGNKWYLMVDKVNQSCNYVPTSVNVHDPDFVERVKGCLRGVRIARQDKDAPPPPENTQRDIFSVDFDVKP